METFLEVRMLNELVRPHTMNEDLDPDATQLVTETVCKKWK